MLGASNTTTHRISPAHKATIKALVESGMSQRAVARQENVSSGTVSIICRGQGLDAGLVDAIKKDMAGKLYDKADLSINSITSEKAEKQSNQSNAITAGILIEKARLCDGQATALVAHHHTAVLKEIETVIPDNVIDVTPEETLPK